VKNYRILTIITLTLLLVLAGCSTLPVDKCLDYRTSPFTLEGRLNCDGREYTLSVDYETDETLSVKLNTPERIAGSVLTLSAEEGADLSFGGVTVKIADKDTMQNYGALVALHELVLPPEEGLLSVELLKLSNRTYNLAVFESPRGKVSVWFDKSGTPVRFEADGVTLSVTAFKKHDSSESSPTG